MEEILKMFRENFPYVSREPETLAEVIGHEGNSIFARRNPEGKLTACAIVNGQTILLLVVDKGHRGLLFYVYLRTEIFGIAVMTMLKIFQMSF